MQKIKKTATTLVGVTFGDAPQNIQALKVGDTLDLESYVYDEGGKNEDKNAVKVTHNDRMCGHISKQVNEEWHGNKISVCKVKRLTEYDNRIASVMVEADLIYEVNDTGGGEKPEVMKSYNEEGIFVDFFPIAHKYSCNTVKLKGVTRSNWKMYKPFEGKFIAKNCEKSWGMDAEEILAMWECNRDNSASFGTAMHGFMEQYHLYGPKGLSKVPMIRDIVLAFPFWHLNVEGVEALITDVGVGLCGQADRLENAEGKVRVTDYKFNIGMEDKKSSYKNLYIDGLPQLKRTKALTQCSIYADMLERSGREVDDYVTTYVFNGEYNQSDPDNIFKIGWSAYTDKRIKNIVELMQKEGILTA